MGKFVDLTNCRFGRLVVIQRAGYALIRNGVKHVRWHCRCDCGAESLVTTSNLRTGNSTSCGCLTSEVTRRRNTTHGESRRGQWTREYRAYQAMLDRCYDQSVRSFKDYGAKGVAVCERWRASYENFLADMGRCPSGLTLDRKNPFGHYEPTNCRWATWSLQAKNKRCHHDSQG